MKVLFEFSRRGIPDHLPAFKFIRDYILQHKHQLTNDLVKDSEKNQDRLPENVFSILQKAISQSDCVIIEGTVASLSLGYVLTESISLGKPVLFLIKKHELDSTNRFATSIQSSLLTNASYLDEADLKNILGEFFSGNKFIKTRFNLVLENQLNSFVTKKSKELGISKTEYIINQIKKQIKNE